MTYVEQLTACCVDDTSLRAVTSLIMTITSGGYSVNSCIDVCNLLS